MSINNVEILIPTYNRKTHLRHTLIQLTSMDSWLKDIPITILDNASTDGTSELIDGFAAKYSNIKHIRHPKNIGGNANIARAFEMARAKYVWVLCDDDEYDFSNWGEAVKFLANNPPAVVVATYMSPQDGIHNLFRQLSFVPAAIYRTDLIDSDTLMNMYFNVSNMFPQLAVAAAAVNSGETLPVLSKPLVTMRVNTGNDSYIRGSRVVSNVHPLLKDMFWALGYLRSIPLLHRRGNRVKCSFYAAAENESFYNFCGRYMANSRGKVYAYATGVHLCRGLAKVLFALLAPAAYVCSFFRDKKGLNIRLFGKIKIRIWKFKNN